MGRRMIIVGWNDAAGMPHRKSFRFKGAASSSAPFVLAQGGRSQAVPKSPNTAQKAHGAELGWCFLCHRPFPGAFLPGFSSAQRVETFYSGYFQFRYGYTLYLFLFSPARLHFLLRCKPLAQRIRAASFGNAAFSKVSSPRQAAAWDALANSSPSRLPKRRLGKQGCAILIVRIGFGGAR